MVWCSALSCFGRLLFCHGCATMVARLMVCVPFPFRIAAPSRGWCGHDHSGIGLTLYFIYSGRLCDSYEVIAAASYVGKRALDCADENYLYGIHRGMQLYGSCTASFVTRNICHFFPTRAPQRRRHVRWRCIWSSHSADTCDNHTISQHTSYSYVYAFQLI